MILRRLTRSSRTGALLIAGAAALSASLPAAAQPGTASAPQGITGSSTAPQAAAETQAPAASGETAATSAVLAPIETLDQGLLAVMRQGQKAPFSQRAQTLTPYIDASLNLPEILREAVGPAWSKLTADQQSRLLAAFRQYTVATFVDNFDSYNGQTISVSPDVRKLASGAQVVRTTITSGNKKEAHTIEYVMRQGTDGKWQATDVLADGTISRVAVLRSDFSDMLSHGGASALEATLQQKTQKLENG